ncbi:hypothetical protein CVT26_011558 [Gymnopilus dilepis]|uniref:Uncharacterized protein n=1 Tax=Gymnopilus dilepis TaxID=231916 RepID=A0A409W955_9AGAR|nr:hypothetical protein CVT26_011558 [Gymnopilus dilepis]
MRELELRMKRAQEKFLQAEREMKDLVNEYGKLISHANAVHDPIFRRLPSEVISIIFQSFAPPIPFERVQSCDSDTDVWAKIKKRLVLGAVCRSWRHAALSTHRLWSYILVRLDSPNPGRSVEIIRNWLGRSGNVPLSIHIYCQQSRPTLYSPYEMVSLLKQESARWQSLNLRVPLHFVPIFVGKGRGTTVFPILRSLRLEPAHSHSWDIVFDCHVVMPKLADVFLSYVHCKHMKIHWALVTWVQLEVPHVNECLELFKDSPQLKYCMLVDLYEDATSDAITATTTSRTIVHHQIVDLHIEWPEPGSLKKLLGQVSFPALKRLCVMGGEDGLAGRPLASFFKRSRCRLEELIAFDSISDNDDLVAALAEVPSLVDLEVTADFCLKGNLSPEPFFKRLSQNSAEGDPHKPIFLPNLQSLEFQPLQAFSWDLLPPIFGLSSQTMVDRPFERPLRTFHLARPANVDKDSLPIMDEKTKLALLAVRDAGVHLHISPLRTFMDSPFDQDNLEL